MKWPVVIPVDPVLDQYGSPASCLVPVVTERLTESSDGAISCDFKLLLYRDETAYVGGAQFTDCFRPRLSDTYSVTQQDLADAPGVTVGAKLARAFLAKAIVSVLDEDGDETNIFTGNIGQIALQGAEIVEVDK